MAAGDALIVWENEVPIVSTGLTTLADGQLWHSADLLAQIGSDDADIFEITLDLIMATWAAADEMMFYGVKGNGDVTPIFNGGLASSASPTSPISGAALDDFHMAEPSSSPTWVYSGSQSSTATLKGVFSYFSLGPNWKLAIENSGAWSIQTVTKLAYRLGRYQAAQV